MVPDQVKETGDFNPYMSDNWLKIYHTSWVPEPERNQVGN